MACRGLKMAKTVMDKSGQVRTTSNGSNEEVNKDIIQCVTGFQKISINDENFSLPYWLQNVESPFNWLPKRFSDPPSKEVIAKSTERIDIDEECEVAFPFEKSVRLLTLVYELVLQGVEGWEEAKKTLEVCDQLIKEQSSKHEETYEQLIFALTHVVRATKAHLLLQEGNPTEARELAENLVPVNSLTESGKAAVEAMKARFFYHYRNPGAKLAVQFARKALELAPRETLWQVLLAECLRRLRKFNPLVEEVSPEEVSHLESATARLRCVRHLILLAQAYRETADALFKQHRHSPNFFQSPMFSHISDLQSKAFALYKEALTLKPYCEMVNRLCGYGLLKLPAFTSDYRLAEHCLQRALELAPNNAATIHSLGLYYYKGLMDYEKAALFCEKAGKLGYFPASLDMLRMKRLVYGENYDPVFDFDKLLKQYGTEATKKHEVLCQMGSYYLFFKRNLYKAIEYFRTLVQEKAERTIMTSHKCTFLNMAHKINLFECVINEGTRLLQDKSSLITDEDQTDLKEIEKFLDELKITNKELFDIPVNIKMIDDLHKVSDGIKQTYVRKKERRDSRKESRRNSLARRRCSLDANLTLTRRYSEATANVRRSSSGSIGDTISSRISKTHSNYKQKFIGNTPFLESGHDSIKYRDKANLSRRHSDFARPYGLQRDSLTDDILQKPVKKVSWTRKSSNDRPKFEDWRRKDNH